MNIMNHTTNSILSPRLLSLLFALTENDKYQFYNLLGYTGLVRLNACCRCLKAAIRNNSTLWNRLYKQHFLSSLYHEKELDFVFWCIRTDPLAINTPTSEQREKSSNRLSWHYNNFRQMTIGKIKQLVHSNRATTASIPKRRKDLLNNVNWYHIYRRRVTTENNWRYGYSNNTIIMNHLSNTKTLVPIFLSKFTDALIRGSRYESDKPIEYYYHLKCSAYLDPKYPYKGKHRRSSSKSFNVTALQRNSENIDFGEFPIIGDHYIVTTFKATPDNNDKHTMAIFSRGHTGMTDTLDLPASSSIKEVRGKWALLVGKPQNLYNTSFVITDSK
jgi:hypothetical protein